MDANFGNWIILHYSLFARLGAKAWGEFGTCHMIHIITYCLFYATPFLLWIRYASCRSVNFINNCLASDSHIIRSTAYRSVFFSRALSPLGRNAQFCCQRYGVSLFDVQSINVNCIKHWLFSKIDIDLMSRVVLLLELLFIRDESFFCLD